MTDETQAIHAERNALYQLVANMVKEQRAARRWGTFFRLSSLFLIIYFLVLPISNFARDLVPNPLSSSAHTAVIEVEGPIDSNSQANASDIIDALETAYTNKNVKGVVLRINSPGGSAVQARQVYDAMRRLQSKSPEIKTYAVIEDMGTSAAYLMAAAADKIYSDRSSLVGSIGVLIDSYGAVDLMHKVGVERRLYTAGQHKGILDPFSPRKSDEDNHIQVQLDGIHELFKANVREGRGDRLKETADIFSGLFWTGEEAHKLGLTDGFGDTRYVARDIIKAENIVDYTPMYNVLDRLSSRIGARLNAFCQTWLQSQFSGFKGR